ncbi:MAG: metal ABC transporter permease [Candidatus Eisenbacteria sp.]|nr:metal ABC transporter permease [Candidatus Eisenbacteria bacterium]
MGEILALEFMRRALAAGVILSTVLATISFFVVLRRFSFIGVGVSHSAFGGVALGALLGVSPTAVAIPFAVGVANAIGVVSRKGKIGIDATIGIFFSLAMALGIIFIGLSDQYNVDLFGYLFGSILAVTTGDLILTAVLGAVILGLTLVLFKEFLFVAFDEEVARASGLPVVLLDHLLLTMLALAVVMSIKVIGIVLVSALLVIPGATALQLTRRYGPAIVYSIVTGLVATVGGLFLSYYADLASGATIVTVASFIFFVALLFGRFRRRAHAPKS